MRIASSTSFLKDDFEAAANQVHDMGFNFIDLIVIPGWKLILPENLVNDFEGQTDWIEGVLERNTLTPIAMNVAVTNPANRGKDEDNRRRREETRAVCRLMKRLGVERAGFFPGVTQGRPWDEAFRDSVESFREMHDIAGEIGVTFGPELHKNTPFENIEQSEALLEALPEISIVWDPSHFVMQGIPVEKTLPFLDRAHHVHARGSANGQMQIAVADSELSPAWFIETLKAKGYRGDLSIEYLPNLPDATDQIVAMRDGLVTALNASA